MYGVYRMHAMNGKQVVGKIAQMSDATSRREKCTTRTAIILTAAIPAQKRGHVKCVI